MSNSAAQTARDNSPAAEMPGDEGINKAEKTAANEFQEFHAAEAKSLCDTLNSYQIELSKGTWATVIPFIPHIADDLKKKVDEAVKARDTANEAVNTAKEDCDASPEKVSGVDLDALLQRISEDEKIMVDALPNKEQKLCFARQFALAAAERKLAAAKDKLAAAKEEVIHIVNRMLSSARDVESTLKECAAMSQAEATVQQGHTATNNAIKAEVDRHIKNSHVLVNASAKAKQLFENEEELDHTKYPYLVDLATAGDDVKQSYDQLRGVAKAWESWILGSQVVDSKNEDLKKKISQGVARMKETISDPPPDVSGPTPDVSGPTPDVRPSFPNFQSDEVYGVQPTVCGLLECIAQCWSSAPPKENFSPCKLKVEQSKVVPPTEYRRKRIVDVCIGKDGRFVLVMLDAFLKLCIELKPLFRQNISNESLNHESLEQEVAHLAKSIYHAFGLFGVGVPSKAVGLTGTLAYISVHELCLEFTEATSLESVSTNHFVNLKLSKSKKLPLMTKKALKVWFNKCMENLPRQDVVKKLTQQLNEKTEANRNGERQHEVNQLNEKLRGEQEKLQRELKKYRGFLHEVSTSLYEENGEGGMDEKGLPMGIRVVWELMAKRRTELFGPDYKELLKGCVGEPLGHGSFGIVFSVKDRANEVLKVPLLSGYHLKREIDMLRELQRDQPEGKDDTKLALPVLVEEKVLELNVGGVVKKLHSLVLEPRGQSILSYLTTTEATHPGGALDKFSTQLEGALNYIHDKGICHNDVAPKNIVVVVAGHPVRSYLVDFGCASHFSKDDDQLSGFVGTADYAHPDVFKQYPGKPWKPKKEYDFFALGLTMAALLKGGVPPWKMPAPKSSYSNDELKKAAEERRVEALNLVNGSRCEEKKAWLAWISLGKDESKKRKRSK